MTADILNWEMVVIFHCDPDNLLLEPETSLVVAILNLQAAIVS